MLLEVIPRVIHILATIYAVIAASIAMRFAFTHSNRKLKQRVDELEHEADRHAAWFAKLNANVASVRATISQQKKEAAEPAPDQEPLDFHQSANETPDQWKRRMRVQMAAGKLHHK